MSDQFQHVMVLTSIIIGLGITNLLLGLSGAIERFTENTRSFRIGWATVFRSILGAFAGAMHAVKTIPGLSKINKTITVVALALAALTVRATELVPYLAMPVGIGYAVDAKGVRQPNAVCLRDAVFAPPLRYPYQLRSTTIGDSAAWARYKGDGLYRVEIDMNTGHVNQVLTIKSTGQALLDKANTNALKRWIFNPGKWREITIPIVVRTKAVSVINKVW